jgi:hypothetical protein
VDEDPLFDTATVTNAVSMQKRGKGEEGAKIGTKTLVTVFAYFLLWLAAKPALRRFQ